MLMRVLAVLVAGCMMVASLPAQQQVANLPSQQAAAAKPVKIVRGTVLQGSLMQPLNPATARPGDDVPLRLTQSLIVDAVVVLPAGSVVHGKVTKVTPAGRHCSRGAVKWKIESIPLPDGSTLKTEVTRDKPLATGKRHYSRDEIVGYVIQDAVFLPAAAAGLVIYEARQAVTAPFQHGRCSRWKNPPRPANAVVAIRVREDHQVR